MGYKYIVNVYGSTDDEVSKYGNYKTWIDYWYSNSLYKIPKICPVKECNEKIDEDNKIVGAHVYICELNEEKKKYSVYTDKIYIAPICNSCNINKKGYKVNGINDIKKYDIMQIDENLLIPHPDYL